MKRNRTECSYKPVPVQDTLFELENLEAMKKRGNKAKWLGFFFFLAACIAVLHLLPQPSPTLEMNQKNSSHPNTTSYVSDSFKTYASKVAEFTLAYSLGELLLVVCLFADEVGCHDTLREALYACLRPHFSIFILPSLFLLVPLSMNILHSTSLEYSVLYSGLHPLLQLILGSRMLIYRDQSIISLGDAMAQGCYSTFYSRVLQGLGQRIEKFEREHNVKVTPRKLIILFPRNCRVAAKLEEWIGPQLSKFGFLDPYNTTVAGCQRSFRLYVYRLVIGSKDYYCLLECPSNLLTLREFMDAASPMGGGFSRLDARGEADNFYRKLVRLCREDLNIQRYFVPLRYSDSDPQQLLGKLQKTVELLDQQEQPLPA